MSIERLRPTMLSLAILPLSAGLAFAQPPATLRTETRVVQIDVEVSDSHGKPVAGLSKEDFTVIDAGRRRQIQFFSREGDAEPVAGPPSGALPPNTFSNRLPASQPTHATVILLDGINNYWDGLAGARLRLLAMVDQLSKTERIAVYAATTKPAAVAVVQDFTTDRARLRRSLQAYRPPPIPPAPGLGPPPPTSPAEEDFRRRDAVRDTMSAFRLLAEHLGKLPGRKSLLWLTSGLPPKQLREMPDPFDTAAAALNEANIAVNVMDDAGVGDIHRRWGSAASSTLDRLAESTGGKAYLRRNDLDKAVLEAIEAPRVSYTLGFYVPDEERDDRFHPLVVRVGRPKLNLEYRRGYYAGIAPPSAVPKKREPLENALLDPQDSAGIPIIAEVVRLPGAPRPLLRISLRLGAAQLSLRQDGDGWSGNIEAMFLETNAAGQLLAKIAGSKQFRMSPRLREAFENDGVPVVQEVELMEGAVRLLIVVRDAESGRTGTLSAPLPEVSAPR